jgi:hypothetical protein
MIDFLKMHEILIPKNVLKTFKIKLAKVFLQLLRV